MIVSHKAGKNKPAQKVKHRKLPQVILNQNKRILSAAVILQNLPYIANTRLPLWQENLKLK